MLKRVRMNMSNKPKPVPKDQKGPQDAQYIMEEMIEPDFVAIQNALNRQPTDVKDDIKA